MKVVLFVAIFALAFAKLAPLKNTNAAERIEGEYVVVYKNAVALKVADRHIVDNNITILHRYRTALNGFHARLTDDEVAAIRTSKYVKYVECNAEVHLWDTRKRGEEVNALKRRQTACVAPYSVNTWGLTRIAEVQPDPDDLYAYPTSGGRGVDAYIIDTGIYNANVDFGGRAKFGYKAEPGWSDEDRNGHGTHVASTTGGLRYGVAPLIDELIGVKVLSDQGSGSWAGVIAGVDWAASQYQVRGKKAVANMSLGGGYMQAINDAVNGAMQLGLVMVVAAGNDNGDACNLSPASAEDVISVGSTTQGPEPQSLDVRSSFSSFGTCLTLFAPGSEITAAWVGSPTATRTISGTSMASPHVCGVSALLLSEGFNSGDIKPELVNTGHKQGIDLSCGGRAVCNQSPNVMLYNLCNVGNTP